MMNIAYCTDEANVLDALARQSFEVLVNRVPVTTSPEPFSDILEYRALVSYEGSECGTVMISCDEAFAFTFTEAFMQVERPSQFDEDTKDALGELVNTIGGNYKGLLGADTSLGTPTVAMASDLRELLKGRSVLAHVTCRFEHGTCEVQLLT